MSISTLKKIVSIYYFSANSSAEFRISVDFSIFKQFHLQISSLFLKILVSISVILAFLTNSNADSTIFKQF